jgi:acetoin utilization deacetylase AcuC-like enzyme
MASTGLVIDAAFLRHLPWEEDHPDCPERYRALLHGFELAGIPRRTVQIASRIATEDETCLCHARAYYRTVLGDVARRAMRLSTGDTAMGTHTLETALLAAGAALAAVDAVFSGRVRNAFAAVRPPGHHATAGRGMGFCVFNSVAIAAHHARKKYGVERVLIVDWDVHHGNGTQEIFYRDPGVFYFSTHQSPCYPGTGPASETGEGAGRGTTMNCPFPAGASRAGILTAFRRKLLPAMAAYRPDLVLVSAGFDGRIGDPLGRFRLRDADYRELTSIVLEIAARSAGGRVVSVLEGGYNPAGLALAATAHVEALLAGQ